LVCLAFRQATAHTLQMEKDIASIAPAETHSGKNIGEAPYQPIVVDLK